MPRAPLERSKADLASWREGQVLEGVLGVPTLFPWKVTKLFKKKLQMSGVCWGFEPVCVLDIPDGGSWMLKFSEKLAPGEKKKKKKKKEAREGQAAGVELRGLLCKGTG